jgi:hypothetical protein
MRKESSGVIFRSMFVMSAQMSNNCHKAPFVIDKQLPPDNKTCRHGIIAL